MANSKMTAEINLTENGTYVVKNGQLISVEIPPLGFGEQVIQWQEGEPKTTKITFTNKIG